MSLQEEDLSPEFARKHFLTGLSEGLPERKDASVSILFIGSAYNGVSNTRTSELR